MGASLILSVKLIVAVVVILRSICLGSKVSRREWYGHPLRFILLAGSYALLTGGALAWLLGMVAAVWLFALGAVSMLLFDRRRQS